MGCCFQDMINIARNTLVQFPSSFFSISFVNIYVVHPYYSMDTTTARKKFRFNSSDRLNFHMIDSLSIAVHAFARRKLISFSVDKTLLPRHMNLSTNFREPPFMIKTYILHFVRIHVGLQCLLLPFWNRDSAWVGAFAKSAMSSA